MRSDDVFVDSLSDVVSQFHARADASPSEPAAAEHAESGLHTSALYRRFYPRLLAYARRMTDSAMAEDIVQEVFLRVIKYKRGDAETLPLQFLLTMTRNVALRMLDSRRRAVGVNAEHLDVPDRAARADEAGGSRLPLPAMLDRLPERQRDAVVLTTGLGLSECEASLAMNCSRSAVSARRRTAIEHLRRVGLGRLDAEPSGGRGRPAPGSPGRDAARAPGF